MFKLLPDDIKKQVETEYKLRRSAIMLFACASVLLIGIVSILPAYVISQSKLQEAQVTAETSRSSASSEETESLAVLASDVRTKLDMLANTRESNAYGSIRDAITLAPNGVSLTSFRLTYKGNVGTLLISGIASTRQELVEYERALNTSGVFSGAELPVSQFAKDRDIEFNVTVTLSRT